MRYSFFVEMKPTTWKRTGQGIKRYTPPEMRRAKQHIADTFCLEYPHDIIPLTGDVSLTLRIVTKNGKKPGDIDNYSKLVMDALQGYAYENDKQVMWLEAGVKQGEPEGFEIEVMTKEAA